VRIAMIGPLPPFRGGIAQHTTMLAHALASRSELLVISYVRQYPRWLYPGARDTDPQTDRLDAPWCRYLLDSLNPVTWKRTAELVLAHNPDAVLLPWWTVYWAPCIAYLSRRFARRGVSVVFLCHNVVDHETAGWKRRLTRMALACGNSFIVQSEAERGQLIDLNADARIVVHPHPVFDQFPSPSGVLARRANLEILFFGFVRDYKGLDLLLGAVALCKLQDLKLTVAGEFWNGAEDTRRLIERLGIGDKVELIDRYVSDEETGALFERADVVAMPYRRATGSGVLGLAYRFRKPVIASRVPGLAELVHDGETGILVEPGSEAALAAAIRSMSAARAQSMAGAIGSLAAGMSWQSLASTILSVVDRRDAPDCAGSCSGAADMSSR
jgi:glycosyltransferase involved in cell wall biosynthesis